MSLLFQVVYFYNSRGYERNIIISVTIVHDHAVRQTKDLLFGLNLDQVDVSHLQFYVGPKKTRCHWALGKWLTVDEWKDIRRSLLDM